MTLDPTLMTDRSGVELRDLSLRYDGRGGRVAALEEVDLTIRPGEFVAVVGPSGCGKTTLLKLIAGFLEPSSGTARFDGETIAGPSPERGVVFQQANLYPWMSVLDNVALGLRFERVPKAHRETEARRQLALVGLEDFADAAPYELSGGMQQRAQIARVLATDPEVLLLDEPFGALDALTRERLQDELHRLWRATGKSALFITHGIEESVYLASRVVVMSPRPGRIIADISVPFAAAPHDRALRSAPEFLALREQVADLVMGDGA